MATSQLSKQNNRKQSEEILRNLLIKHMIEELGFPSSSILKEKSLSSLKTLLPQSFSKLPLRRVDIAVTTPCSIHGLRLLLLVECKTDLYFLDALKQAQGYNHHLGSPFLWVVSEKRSEILFWNRGEDNLGSYIPFALVPSYMNLLEYLKRSETS